MNIREAQIKDLDQLAILFDKYRQFYKQASDVMGAEAFIRERLTQKDYVILLACNENEVAGFIQLYPSFSSVAMRRIYVLNDLYVSSAARKQGVATALIQEAKKCAAKAGAVRLALATERTNTSVQALYEKLNWLKDEKFIHFNVNVEG